MATIPFNQLDKALTDINEFSAWIWTVENDTVTGGKDDKPSHTPKGEWVYHPSLRERYADEADTYNKIKNSESARRNPYL